MYRYVGDNPMTAFDQMGTFSCVWCSALGLEHPCGQSWCWTNCDDGKNCPKTPPRKPPLKPRKPVPPPPFPPMMCGAIGPMPDPIFPGVHCELLCDEIYHGSGWGYLCKYLCKQLSGLACSQVAIYCEGIDPDNPVEVKLCEYLNISLCFGEGWVPPAAPGSRWSID